MTDEPIRIHLFRSERFTNGVDTVICAAPVDLVQAAYGGGHRDQEGVQRAFGGNAFYRNDQTGKCFIGVWGARNASFRTAPRRKAAIVIINEPPLARLVEWNTADHRPSTAAQRGTDWDG